MISRMLFCALNYVSLKKVLKERKLANDAFDYTTLIWVYIAFVILSIAGVCLYRSFLTRVAIAFAFLIVAIVKKDYFIELYAKIKQ